MVQVLAHPLTVLLVGAALTGFLAPLALRALQDRKMRVDLKVSLIQEMVMVMEKYFADLHRLELKGPDAQVTLDDAFTSAREAALVLQARLEASVPSAGRAIKDWQDLTGGFGLYT
jgi:hypothetical protein